MAAQRWVPLVKQMGWGVLLVGSGVSPARSQDSCQLLATHPNFAQKIQTLVSACLMEVVKPEWEQTGEDTRAVAARPWSLRK